MAFFQKNVSNVTFSKLQYIICARVCVCACVHVNKQGQFKVSDICLALTVYKIADSCLNPSTEEFCSKIFFKLKLMLCNVIISRYFHTT